MQCSLLYLKIVLFGALLFAPLTSLANKNCALIVGGGYEWILPVNNFANSYNSYFGFIIQRGWQVSALWNNAFYPNALDPTILSKELTSENIKKNLKRLFSGECDKVLLIGLTHGSGTNGAWDDKIQNKDHGWAMSGNNFLPIRELYDVIRTRPKNVRFGIIDESCYSGNSIDILGSVSDCVISSAGRKLAVPLKCLDSMGAALKTVQNSTRFSFLDFWTLYASICGHQYKEEFALQPIKPDNSQMKIYDTDDKVIPVSSNARQLLQTYGKHRDELLSRVQSSTVPLGNFHDYFYYKTNDLSAKILKEAWEVILSEKKDLDNDTAYAAKLIENYLSIIADRSRNKCGDFNL